MNEWNNPFLVLAGTSPLLLLGFLLIVRRSPDALTHPSLAGGCGYIGMLERENRMLLARAP